MPEMRSIPGDCVIATNKRNYVNWDESKSPEQKKWKTWRHTSQIRVYSVYTLQQVWKRQRRKMVIKEYSSKQQIAIKYFYLVTIFSMYLRAFCGGCCFFVCVCQVLLISLLSFAQLNRLNELVFLEELKKTDFFSPFLSLFPSFHCELIRRNKHICLTERIDLIRFLYLSSKWKTSLLLFSPIVSFSSIGFVLPYPLASDFSRKHSA